MSGVIMMALMRGNQSLLSVFLFAPWEHSKKAAICKSGTELSLELDHAGTPILDFQPPEWGENKFLLCKPASLWYFVMAAWAD